MTVELRRSRCYDICKILTRYRPAAPRRIETPWGKREGENTPLRQIGFFDFGDLHFEGLSFSAMDSNLFALAEHARGWMEKQYLFVCDRFLGKFSLAELSYSYRLCGRYRATEAHGG